LSRNAAFLLTLRDSGVKFVAADLPDANELTIGILAVVAQHERERISERTKAALAEAKRRGTKLGNPNGARALRRAFRKLGNRPAIAAVRAKASAFAEELRPIIEDIEAAGITSNRGIAAELKRREIRTARGTVEGWTDTTVGRLRARLDR
jgi:DNA invertase Pin-like site-specific DNA recombinase